MKVIDCTPKPAKASVLDQYVKRAQVFLDQALSLPKDEQAQERFIRFFSKALGGRYVLLRNLKLESVDVPIPMILIGPSGTYVIHGCARKGVFRAQGESLVEATRGQEFVPSRPNLISRTNTMARAVNEYIKQRGYEAPEVQGVLFFSHPGTHIDSIRPAIRILLVDGMERFASGLVQAAPVFAREDVQVLAELLSTPPPQPEPETPKPESKEPEKLHEGLGAKQMLAISNKVRFKPWQWAMLGGFALLDILILIGLVFLVFTLK